MGTEERRRQSVLTGGLMGNAPEQGRPSCTPTAPWVASGHREGGASGRGAGACKVLHTQGVLSYIPAPVWLPPVSCQFHNQVPFLLVSSRAYARGVQREQGGGHKMSLESRVGARERVLHASFQLRPGLP